MENCAIILAAGEGKRMKSQGPKVLCQVLFKPMLEWVIDAVEGAGVSNICVVTGHLHSEVESFLDQLAEKKCRPAPFEHVFQAEQKGTAHAVMMAEQFLHSHSGANVLILSGDAPFLDPETIGSALAEHQERQQAVTVISAEPADPFGYGRIVRDSETGALRAIVEEKEANVPTKQIREINSGAYWFRVDSLLSVLNDIQNNNSTGEYYLPDAIRLLLSRDQKAGAFLTGDSNVVLGANDRRQLAELNSIAKQSILLRLMADGVDIPCPDGILIGPDVTVGPDTRILPGSILTGHTRVGAGCIVGPNALLENTTAGDGCVLQNVQCHSVSLNDGQTPEPFTTLRAPSAY
ncbi:sugar phosphate nucleotidyltransferase [Faecalispora anaeroviscerum]|uniref:sugar phosphate nucleotidyltransferase n=1 Tax=Faecalispora anaeroviscerum TaxID=2991836 RepID=UPI0024B9A5C3|nr:sugar phosphate nucleotidyltransferase [Faecalispora anaeroviscerum]